MNATTEATNRASRRDAARRTRKIDILASTKAKFAAGALAIGGIAAPFAGGMPAAHAYSWSSTVILQGHAQCGGNPWNPNASWMWVSANNGEQGWANVDRNTGSYSFRFNGIGGGSGAWVTINYGCPNGASRTTGFGVARPSTSYYTTRNLY